MRFNGGGVTWWDQTMANSARNQEVSAFIEKIKKTSYGKVLTS